MPNLTLNALQSAVTIASTLLLSPGKPLPVQISGSQIWISDPKVIEVQPLQNQRALLVAKQPQGEAFIYGLRKSNINRVVITSAQNIAAFKRCPNDAKELGIESDGSLSMTTLNVTSLRRLEACGFDRLSAKVPSELDALFGTRQTEIQKAGFAPSQSRLRDGRMQWRVPTSSLAKLKSALGNLHAFSDIETINDNEPDTIIFKIDLFEFSKSSSHELDLKGVVSGSDGIGGRTLTSHADLSLIYAKAHRSGRLIASPQLRTMPGKTAEFNSGGEIPIQDAQVIGAKTSWKPYGLKILITPSPSATPMSEEISTTIQIEYSQPDYGNSMQGVPALVTRNLKNEFHLAMSQTTLLTSMVQVRRGDSRSSTWGFSSIPLIGGLFRNQVESNDESEVWFLISPHWASPSIEGQPSSTWTQYGHAR